MVLKSENCGECCGGLMIERRIQVDYYWLGAFHTLRELGAVL